MDRRFTFALACTAALACKHPDDPNIDETSGFNSQSVGEVEEGIGNDDGKETWGAGELRGIVTFTLYPADALGGVDELGFAGAWRTSDEDVEVIDDFYAAFALGTAFPLPPGVDELAQNDIPAGFVWGDVEDWVIAGTAFKLSHPEEDVQAQACLREVGMVLDIYPVYAAAGDTNDGCGADASQWVPGKDYDFVIYGGEMFDDVSYHGAVETPAALEVTAPDFEEYNAPVMQSDALTVQWKGDDPRGYRLVIRVWDDLGRMFTINAEDDGEYRIPADALAVLTPGPITMTVAREHIERIPIPAGGVKVVTRYERWGYFDLVAEAPQ
jgi:hypothetical protein